MDNEIISKRLVSNRIPPQCDETDKYAAKLLIQAGNKNNDELTKKIGQARLRLLENRETADDLVLLGIRLK